MAYVLEKDVPSKIQVPMVWFFEQEARLCIFDKNPTLMFWPENQTIWNLKNVLLQKQSNPVFHPFLACFKKVWKQSGTTWHRMSCIGTNYVFHSELHFCLYVYVQRPGKFLSFNINSMPTLKSCHFLPKKELLGVKEFQFQTVWLSVIC